MHEPNDHNHEEGFDGFSIEEIKENFKALSNELETGGTPITSVIETIDGDQDQIDNPQPFFRGYIPTIKDYLEPAG